MNDPAKADIDVSYVDGYTVPITCSCDSTPVTGCNYDLFSLGPPCLDEAGGTCYNPAVADTGKNTTLAMIPDFFKPCNGAAYCWPTDDHANVGCDGTVTINCCIGTDCPAPPRQPVKGLSRL